MKFLTGVAVLMCAASASDAATITYSRDLNFASIDGDYAIGYQTVSANFPAFDPAMGKLNSVKFEYHSDIRTSVNISVNSGPGVVYHNTTTSLPDTAIIGDGNYYTNPYNSGYYNDPTFIPNLSDVIYSRHETFKDGDVGNFEFINIVNFTANFFSASDLYDFTHAKTFNFHEFISIDHYVESLRPECCLRYQLESKARGSISVIYSYGVPEPATWALMLLGFGAIAAVMRRDRANMSLRYT